MASTSDAPDDAPPPYTPVDPLTPASTIEFASTAEAAAEQRTLAENDAPIPSYDSVTAIPNFISASPYFMERPPPAPHQAQPQEPILQHTLTIYPRSQSKDYQRFPKCLRPRSAEITQHDWETFLNYIFPLHLGPAASQSHLPRKLRAEIQRDRKDCAQEGDDERQARVEAVFTEWNKYFFVPRSTEILYTYVSSSDAPPATHLCPKCYPSTVRSLPVRSGRFSSGIHLARSASTPSCSSHCSISYRPVGPNPRSTPALAPEVSTATAQGSTTTPFASEDPNSDGAGGGAYDHRYAPANGIAGATNAIVNWATQLGERAEQYGQWISDQATAHGKLVEERSLQYGRMIEERAKARAEHFEQQAKYFGRGARGPGGGRGWGRGGPGTWGPFGHMHHHGYRHVPHHGWGGAWGNQPAHPWSGWDTHRRNSQTGQRQRSASVSSTSSSSSSSSTSSSSSSDSNDSFLSSISSYSQRHAAGLADFKEKIGSIQWEHEQSRARARMDVQRSDIADLHQELRILRTAHKQFRSTKRAKRGTGTHLLSPRGSADSSANTPGGGTGVVSDMKSKETQRALKQDIQNTKQQFRSLVTRIRQEKKELRRNKRQRRKEAKRERREGKRQERRNNKGKYKDMDSGKC
ncbi:hypothetical protein AJ78_00169 [Emergomyces pasteurianus Ep9510]|uniref:Uncharacterized protein n=1 Tax=Emergomyces pasteurianus Ep9510 TaxID=1447872 RepID=A0A1J9QUT8_9EURO|nr:hypothetical protein AJ78_00169 [Emergomyces pasteurianus Ep9510]